MKMVTDVNFINPRCLVNVSNYFDIDVEDLFEFCHDELLPSNANISAYFILSGGYIYYEDYLKLISALFKLCDDKNTFTVDRYNILTSKPEDLSEKDSLYNGWWGLEDYDNLYLFFLNPYFDELYYDKNDSIWQFIFSSDKYTEQNICDLYLEEDK